MTITMRKLLLVAVLAAAALAAFIESGLYNVGADDPHYRPVFAAMQSLREHSIRARSRNLTPPHLDDPSLILKGAGQYAAMCTGCHLTPGMTDSELRKGMYPQPPNLTRMRVDPRDAFWVIKHGVKMSAMPAWGVAGHDDATIWSIVAFVRKLPDLSPAQYRDLVAKAPPDDDMDMGTEMKTGSPHDPASGDATHVPANTPAASRATMPDIPPASTAHSDSHDSH